MSRREDGHATHRLATPALRMPLSPTLPPAPAYAFTARWRLFHTSCQMYVVGNVSAAATADGRAIRGVMLGYLPYEVSEDAQPAAIGRLLWRVTSLIKIASDAAILLPAARQRSRTAASTQTFLTYADIIRLPHIYWYRPSIPATSKSRKPLCRSAADLRIFRRRATTGLTLRRR